MKKSLLALAVLGAFAGVASAQSSVTLYGTVDVNGRYVKNDGSNKRYSLSTDGINSSQLGFKGVEDLGGGLKAGFDLLAGVNADVGGTNAKFFNRRSIVELGGNFGRVRLGRDYVPTFWNNTIFDAFGTNGLGDSSGIKQLAAGQFVRADNAIQYYLPAGIGGVYGQFMAAAAENTASGRYIGGRVGFAAGPFDVAVAYGQERVASVAGACSAAGTFGSTPGGACVVATGTGIATNEQYKTANVGGSYDLGVVKLMGYYAQEKIVAYKDQIFSLSAVVPLGQGEIHVGGEQSKLTGPTANNNKVKKFALGYVYNLSKRTALYSTAAVVDNDSASNLALGGGNSPTALGTSATTPGGKSKGIEFGLRHFF